MSQWALIPELAEVTETPDIFCSESLAVARGHADRRYTANSKNNQTQEKLKENNCYSSKDIDRVYSKHFTITFLNTFGLS